VLVAVVVGVGGFAATRSELLDVDEVQVVLTGDGPLTAAEVVEVAGVSTGAPMVTVDLDALAARVRGLAYAAEVVVERDWPSTVRVWVVARLPVVSAVEPKGRIALLDAGGIVLEHVARTDPLLPTIRVDRFGEPGSLVTRIGPLLHAAEAVSPDLGAWILALSPAGHGVRAEMVGGVMVDLGLGEDYVDEMRSLATVLTWVELRCLESINVSIPQNPVVVRSTTGC
jgi:cell division protein FtsQ